MKKTSIIFFLIIALMTQVITCSSQNSQGFLTPAETLDKSRLTGVSIAGSVIFTGTLIGLYHLWYKQYPKSKFHLFNDSKEWKQMDKLGHAFTSYVVSRTLTNVFRWTGLNSHQSMWAGVGTSMLFVTSIEILDSFSEGWGFSVYDLTANVAGAGLLVSQQYLWNEQRITMKLSFRQSPYAQYRPNLLGSNYSQQLIKDYNGMKFWLGFNLRSFFPNSNIPHWTSLAVGYSANGMIGGRENPPLTDINGKPLHFERYRQWFIAPDADLWRLPDNNQAFNTLFEGLHFIKFPAPSLEFNKVQKVRLHPLYIRN